IQFAGMVSPFGAVRLMGGSIGVAYTVQACASLIAAAAVVVVWRRGLSMATRAAVLASATLVAAPLSLLYDLMLASIAALWLLRAGRSLATRGWEIGAFAALVPALLLSSPMLAEKWHLPLFPFAALALFALATGRALRELTQCGDADARFGRARESAA